MKILRPERAGGGPKRLAPWAWNLLMISIIALAGALLFANLRVSLVAPGLLNPLQMRQLPEAMQVQEPWRDVLLPLTASAAACLAASFLPHRTWAHLLVSSLLALVSTRYFIWRATTINTAHPVSFAFSLVFFLCEATYLISLLLQFYPSLFFRPGQRRREADTLRPWLDAHAPSVDIFIPTYNEAERLIRRCVLACRNIEYANKTIHILDDGHRSSIARLAEELGVHYLSRPDNRDRKAGNLNHALAHTSGELIAVFDCDFIPFARFLERTAGFFSDASVALVQTPQHYFNADFHNRNLGVDVVLPGDMDYFFHYVQVLRDRFNCVICCGTSCVVRRAALEQIGGYVTHCIVEDSQTGTRLLTRGWRIVYIDEILSLGEVPRTFRDYLEQRLRWLQGNVQIFCSPREMPIWNSLDRWQTASYVTLLISLFTPLFRAVYIVFPLLSLLAGFTLIAAPPIEYISYGLPFILMHYVLGYWQTDGHYFQYWTEVYEALFCFPALMRLVRLIRDPFRRLGSLVTNKSVNHSEQTVDLPLALPFLVYLALFALALLSRYGVPLLDVRWYRSPFEGEALMLAWNFYNALLMGVCLLACVDKPVRRRTDRFPLELISCLELDGREFWGVTGDVSEEGAGLLLTTSGPSSQGGKGILRVPQYDLRLPVQLMRITLQDGYPLLGLRFLLAEQQAEAAMIRLIYGESSWFQKLPRISFLDSLFVLLGSVFRAEPIVQRY
ncbi:glycosyltransferase [Synechococcus sp. RSCCF101]|uniref:glycosyltransferase n=1 Tax=Synechococcus sp. RSCCF101 TaxID=2511069 RepID=UPI0012467954|nr:glycosyltransferase [Synechococcus sp. RSCCF101]QEY32463.1 glycosyltransferase [Synechococcus sp. RSCCF101]